jgi:ABC-type Mn2+/Zn2+ transport system ATPase subunit
MVESKPLTDQSEGLRISDLAVDYPAGRALDGLTFEVPRGASLAVLGPNGAGKTTLLHAIAGLIGTSHGEINPGAATVALVPQEISVEPMFPITALDVVRMGRYQALGMFGRFRKSDHDLVAKACSQLEIGEFAEMRFGNLSGGQKRRVLLAQVVAQDADLILLDEPFAGVDVPTVEAIKSLITSWGSSGRTVIVTTHDLESSARDYDFVAAINRELVAFGPADRTLSEEVLTTTFAGRIARVGDFIVDTAHHHHGAG